MYHVHKATVIEKNIYWTFPLTESVNTLSIEGLAFYSYLALIPLTLLANASLN